MTLLKTSLLNAIAVLIKMLAMLGINKILAVYVGPNGYALIGQFQNVIQMVTTVAGGAVNTGVTKYTAEYHDVRHKRMSVWHTATFIALLNSLLCAVFLIIFKVKLAEYFLADVQYANIFVWLAAALVALTFNTLLLSILNGNKQILRLVIANIIGSVLSLVIIGILSWQYKLYGALLALSIYQGVGLVSTVAACYGADWFKARALFGVFDFDAGKKLLSFALMTLVSAIAMPLCSVMIRRLLVERFDESAAGYWEAMSRVSSAYMLFLTSILAVYFLPRFSEIKDKSEFRAEIKRGLQLLFLVAALMSSGIYLFRDYIIVILFSDQFKPMASLFAYQMLGDTVKVCGWLLGYVLLSKAMVRIFIVAEIAFSLSYYILVYFFTLIKGFEGISWAYFLNYCGYFFALFCTLRYVFRKMHHE